MYFCTSETVRVATGRASGVKTCAKTNTWITNTTATPDRSRPGSPKAASGAVGQRGAGGKLGYRGSKKEAGVMGRDDPLW